VLIGYVKLEMKTTPEQRKTEWAVPFELFEFYHFPFFLNFHDCRVPPNKNDKSIFFFGKLLKTTEWILIFYKQFDCVTSSNPLSLSFIAATLESQFVVN
jgi:hypothetical protein